MKPITRNSCILIGISVGLVLSGQARLTTAFTYDDLGQMFRGSVNRLAEQNGDRLSREEIQKNREISTESVRYWTEANQAHSDALKVAQNLKYPQSVNAIKSRFGDFPDYETYNYMRYINGNKVLGFWIQSGQVVSYEAR